MCVSAFHLESVRLETLHGTENSVPNFFVCSKHKKAPLARPKALSGYKVSWGTWIRTTVNGSKGRCPAAGRSPIKTTITSGRVYSGEVTLSRIEARLSAVDCCLAVPIAVTGKTL